MFTHLIEKLGVSGVQFEELLGIDTAELLQLHPLYGVIFLFKWPRAGAPAAQTDTSKPLDGSYDYVAADRLFFAAQVIQNACATQALLALLLNHDASAASAGFNREKETLPDADAATPIAIGDMLASFKEFTHGFPADLLGEALSNSDEIRSVHNSFARSSPFVNEDARAPADDDDDGVYHFIAYTCADGTLYELDGLQPAPISHGPCAGLGELPMRLPEVLQRRIARHGEGEIRFALLALTRDRREVYREVGDEEGLRREEEKRKAWAWENALRGANMVGFVGEMLKMVVADKVREGRFEEWIEGAKKETARKRGNKGV